MPRNLDFAASSVSTAVPVILEQLNEEEREQCWEALKDIRNNIQEKMAELREKNIEVNHDSAEKKLYEFYEWLTEKKQLEASWLTYFKREYLWCATGWFTISAMLAASANVWLWRHLLVGNTPSLSLCFALQVFQVYTCMMAQLAQEKKLPPAHGYSFSPSTWKIKLGASLVGWTAAYWCHPYEAALALGMAGFANLVLDAKPLIHLNRDVIPEDFEKKRKSLAEKETPYVLMRLSDLKDETDKKKISDIKNAFPAIFPWKKVNHLEHMKYAIERYANEQGPLNTWTLHIRGSAICRKIGSIFWRDVTQTQCDEIKIEKQNFDESVQEFLSNP